MSPEDAERAFAEFVRSQSTGLYSYTYYLCGNRQLAYDILQSAFMKVWKAWPNLRDQDSVPLAAYMYRTIRTVLVDYHRRTQRHPEAVWDDERDGQLPDDCNVAEEAIFRAFGRDLRAALATLDKTQQDLIFLIYFEQLSTAAASRKLALTGTTARRYQEAALSRLREMIGYSIEEDQDGGR